MKSLEPLLDAADERRRNTPMTVMVFGPGKSSKLWDKRKQIRAELNKLPGVTAYFPEEAKYAEPYLREYRIPKGDAVALEALQAQDADVIVALEPGPGVEAEVAVFSRRPAVAHKLLDLLPGHYKKTAKSYAGQLRSAVAKHYYTGEELKVCTLATKIVVEHVSSRQVQKGFL